MTAKSQYEFVGSVCGAEIAFESTKIAAGSESRHVDNVRYINPNIKLQQWLAARNQLPI